MAQSDIQAAFYDHKRATHNGDYKNGCPECEQKFAALKAESEAKAKA